jgi:acyl-lipid omega-6 desaturase (Delta-12 desaturase)
MFLQWEKPPGPVDLSRYPWPPWYSRVTAFRKRSLGKAMWQLANTIVPYALLWWLMIRFVRLGYSWLLLVPLAVLAAGFLARIFIFFHDCVHGSFFASKRANTLVGYACGILAFTPLEDWRFSHFRHHDTYANLDARGYGDITLMTVDEYRQASRRQRLLYRLYRSPWVIFGLGPLFHFMFRQRFPTKHTGRLEHRSVLVADLGIVVIALMLSWVMGWKAYLIVQSAVLWLAGAAGIWLFYVQHQFEGVYWARTAEWDPVRAAFMGASFYDLPAVLRWFSGNIGYHFVHHIEYGIPNYNLPSCYRAIPELQDKARLTWRGSLHCVSLKLWDEKAQKLVGWPRRQPERST